MHNFKFTTDWFLHNIPSFNSVFKHKVNKILEIGSYEGRSTVYWINKWLTDNGTITVVDPRFKYEALKEPFLHNVSLALKENQNLIIHGDTSENIVNNLKEKYDLIFIDGDHSENSVYNDSTMSWGKLKKGGLLFFDDYEWSPEGSDDKPTKRGIDRFLKEFNQKYKLRYMGYSVILEKS